MAEQSKYLYHALMHEVIHGTTLKHYYSDNYIHDHFTSVISNFA